MSTVLHAEALKVGHGQLALVSGVSIRLQLGEVVSLIGINGSGKTTLLRTMAGIQKPLGGTVRMGAKDLHACSAMERARHVALVLTGRPAPGLLDVKTLVSLGRQPWTDAMGRLSTVDKEKVRWAMDLAGVEPLADRSVDRLSDGEMQRVSIARALAQDTPVLLLDEPTAHLDLVNRVQLLRMLRHIAQRASKAVLLSTHDLHTALDHSDLVALLYQRQLWCGEVSDPEGERLLGRMFSAEGLRFDAASRSLR